MSALFALTGGTLLGIVLSSLCMRALLLAIPTRQNQLNEYIPVE